MGGDKSRRVYWVIEGRRIEDGGEDSLLSRSNDIGSCPGQKICIIIMIDTNDSTD